MSEREPEKEIIFFTPFFPSKKGPRAPWMERFYGLYGRVFWAEDTHSHSLCWYTFTDGILRSRKGDEITEEKGFDESQKEKLLQAVKQAATKEETRLDVKYQKELLKEY